MFLTIWYNLYLFQLPSLYHKAEFDKWLKVSSDFEL